VSGVPRDQGFTRPKALILLPMRHMAFAVVRRLVALAQKETRADSVQVGFHKHLHRSVFLTYLWDAGPMVCMMYMK
jgi:hypothetical protein